MIEGNQALITAFIVGFVLGAIVMTLAWRIYRTYWQIKGFFYYYGWIAVAIMLTTFVIAAAVMGKAPLKQ